MVEVQEIQLSLSSCFRLGQLPVLATLAKRRARMRATRRQELAKQMLPDPGQWAVNASHLPGDLLGGFCLPWKCAAMSRKTLPFSTPGVWFQFMMCIRESALDQFGAWKKKKKKGYEGKS